MASASSWTWWPTTSPPIEAINPDWQNPEYFHDKNACKGRDINYSNRWEVTHCQLLGLWDLNTANKTVESRMHDFLKTAVDDGVDGFRFDAGSTVELPGEFDNSTYWDVILQNRARSTSTVKC